MTDQHQERRAGAFPVHGDELRGQQAPPLRTFFRIEQGGTYTPRLAGTSDQPCLKIPSPPTSTRASSTETPGCETPQADMRNRGPDRPAKPTNATPTVEYAVLPPSRSRARVPAAEASSLLGGVEQPHTAELSASASLLSE